ncbi:MAG TPA: hypothetical protein VJV79_01275 [Polyangiaceae bacterium]|nr:hypothetical protein [Polyangiaceae bacterium]
MENQQFSNARQLAIAATELGDVTLPGELGPLQFLQQSNTHFDTGSGVPAVAVNSSGVVLSVHASGGKYYYDRGQVTIPSNGVTWHGSSKEYGSGSGDPCIAIDAQNNVVVLQWDQSHGQIFFNTGSYDAATAEISWLSKTPALLANGSLSPAVAANDAGVVVAAYLGTGTDGLYVYAQLGQLQAGNPIIWQPAGPLSLPRDVSGCSVTINNNGDILLSVISDTTTLTIYGSVAPGANSISWSTVCAPRSFALNSSIAIDDNAVAIETTFLDGLPSYTVGKLGSVGPNETVIKWAYPGWSVPNLPTSAKSVTFAVNGSYAVVLWQNDNKYYSGVAVGW